MKRMILICGGLLLVPVIMFATGCRKSASSSARPQNSATANQVRVEGAGKDAGASTEQSAQDREITVALAELSANDRTLALKQKICPVSGERLGEMGAPVKIDVKGQPVFICCEGCRDKLLAKPDEYLAKINK